MNDKLMDDLISFFNSVSYYIFEEYPSYYKKFHKEKTLSSTFDLVKMYYLGGNNTPDTAGYIVQYFQKN